MPYKIAPALRALMEKADALRTALDSSPLTHGYADEREALHVAILDAREALGMPIEEPPKKGKPRKSKYD
jgi:hypothetical protein